MGKPRSCGGRDVFARAAGQGWLPHAVLRRRCLSTKLELQVTEQEAKVIVAKFANEDKPELINYIAFSNTVDPPNRADLTF